MSLATRCTACGTIFRVVQDQLKVSDGWVRCGRCDAVFNAASGCFELELESPPDWQPTAPPSVERVLATPGVADGFATDDERRWSEAMAAQESPVQDEPATESRALDEQAQAPGLASSLRPSPSSRTFGRDSDEADDDAIIVTDHAPGDLPLPLHASGGAALPGSAPGDPAPSFVQRARRDAFWQSRRARGLLGGVLLLLLLALVLQIARHFSELAAARLPVLRPALTAWCGLSGCSLAPPRRIDDIVVESTALSPAATGLRLAVMLRNRATYAVAMPSIDLSLTDITGQLIARRALSPHDFQVTATAIPAGSDLPLQAVLTAGGAPVSGYTVEIFYP